MKLIKNIGKIVENNPCNSGVNLEYSSLTLAWWRIQGEANPAMPPNPSMVYTVVN